MKKESGVRRRERVVWIVLLGLVMAAIFVLSGQDTKKSEDLSDSVATVLQVEQAEAHTRASNQPLAFGLTLRKMAHVCLFMGLGFCMAQSLKGWKWRVPGAVGFSYLYALTDELHQQLTGRHGRWEDTLIDLAGIIPGVLLALALSWVWERLKKRAACGRAG